MFRSKTPSDKFQEQSSATIPPCWIDSRSSRENVLLLVGFRTIAEEGIRPMLVRLCTSRNFLSLAAVHFLGSSCRNSYTRSLGTGDLMAIRTGMIDSPCRISSLSNDLERLLSCDSWTFLFGDLAIQQISSQKQGGRSRGQIGGAVLMTIP